MNVSHRGYSRLAELDGTGRGGAGWGVAHPLLQRQSRNNDSRAEATVEPNRSTRHEAHDTSDAHVFAAAEQQMPTVCRLQSWCCRCSRQRSRRWRRRSLPAQTAELLLLLRTKLVEISKTFSIGSSKKLSALALQCQNFVIEGALVWIKAQAHCWMQKQLNADREELFLYASNTSQEKARRKSFSCCWLWRHSCPWRAQWRSV